MAGVLVPHEDDSQYVSVVLRVKRKRGTVEEGPPDALVLASKVIKLEEEDKDSNGVGNVDSIFHWCGSYNEDKKVKEDDKPLLDIVKKFNNTNKRPAQSKIGPFHKLSISDSKEQAKVAKKKSSDSNRFKLLSSRRCLSDEEREGNVKPLHLYEVIIDDTNKHKPPVEEAMSLEEHNGISNGCTSTNNKDGASLITCNSTVLVREKLPLQATNDDDYVYDVYLSHQCNMETVTSFDWSTLSVYSYHSELVHDIIESDDDKYDDEDDSNDESNWRNDYPDEENDESDNSSSTTSSDDGDHSHYRHREPYYDELDFFPNPSSYYDNDDYYNGGRGADDYDTDDEEFV